MKNLRSIFQYLKPYRLRVLAVFVFFSLSTLFSAFTIGLVVPFLNILFEIDQKQSAVPTTGVSGNYMSKLNGFINETIHDIGKQQALVWFSIAFIGFTLLKNICRYLGSNQMAQLRTRMVRDIRRDVYNKLLRLPISYFSYERKGDLLSRLTNDVFQVEFAMLGTVEMIFRDPFQIVLYLTTLFAISKSLTLFIFACIPIGALFIARVGKKLKNSSGIGQVYLGKLMSIIEEGISGIRVIKGFAVEDLAGDKFDAQNEDLRKQMLKVNRREYLASPLSEVVISSILAAVMWYGGTLILDKDSSLQPSFFIFYIITFSQIIAPGKAISEAFFRLKKSMASNERIEEIIHQPEPIKDPEQPVKLNLPFKEITFENVCFSYGDVPVLKNINLTIKAGETVALVGASGAGKSTLADLVPRFHDLTSGRILIDGVDIRNFTLKDLRSMLGIVTQQAVLFNDTVFNNIALAKPSATQQEVEDAARVAHAADFIANLPNGYQTDLGEGGNTLSGGQKQRLTIARAVLKNPALLILDEATSALDTESEKAVQDALKSLMENRTALIIAHRLSTIQHADKIVVMQDGEIIEIGKHAELIAQSGTYNRLVELQNLNA